jgi:signal transduction histidine kinase
MEADQIDEFLRVVALQSERLTRLVDDLLILGSLDAGGMVIDPESVLLVPALERTIAEEPGSDGLVGLRVSAGAPASIQTDPLRLHQIVANLVANAIKYAGEGGPITVSVEAGSHADVTISVSDAGPGIPDDEISKVFDTFYRTAGGRATSDGSGLGLAICRRLAEALGGELSATSEVDRGTTFVLRLPQEARTGTLRSS